MKINIFDIQGRKDVIKIKLSIEDYFNIFFWQKLYKIIMWKARGKLVGGENERRPRLRSGWKLIRCGGFSALHLPIFFFPRVISLEMGCKENESDSRDR